jgi:hypothetical protein
MLKPVFDYVIGFFKKNPFFKLKVGNSTYPINYCRTISIQNDDGTMEIISNEVTSSEIKITLRSLASGGGSGGSFNVREQTFLSLTSGTTVTVSAAVSGNIYWVYRNGLQQVEGVDYTRTGTTFTFGTAFGVLSGGVGSEEVYIIHFY